MKQNNTTNAWERTGLFPFNPLCEAWTTAIATLGCITEKQKEHQKVTVSYEVQAKNNNSSNILTLEQKNQLQEDLDLGEPGNDFGDYYVAKIRANCMLARWRDDIEKAVEEGNDREEYSSVLKPGPKTEAEKLALTLIEFFRPDRAETIDLTQTQKEEVSENCENTVRILNGTALGDGITLTYYSSSDSK